MLFSETVFEELKKELCFLERKERIAIYCRFWKDMDTFEIGKTLHMSWPRADKLITQALSKLRKNLSETHTQKKKIVNHERSIFL